MVLRSGTSRTRPSAGAGESVASTRATSSQSSSRVQRTSAGNMMTVYCCHMSVVKGRGLPSASLVADDQGNAGQGRKVDLQAAGVRHAPDSLVGEDVHHLRIAHTLH